MHVQAVAPSAAGVQLRASTVRYACVTLALGSRFARSLPCMQLAWEELAMLARNAVLAATQWCEEQTARDESPALR